MRGRERGREGVPRGRGGSTERSGCAPARRTPMSTSCERPPERGERFFDCIEVTCRTASGRRSESSVDSSDAWKKLRWTASRRPKWTPTRPDSTPNLWMETWSGRGERRSKRASERQTCIARTAWRQRQRGGRCSCDCGCGSTSRACTLDPPGSLSWEGYGAREVSEGAYEGATPQRVCKSAAVAARVKSVVHSLAGMISSSARPLQLTPSTKQRVNESTNAGSGPETRATLRA